MPMEFLREPSKILVMVAIHNIEEVSSMMDPFINFLKNGTISVDSAKAQKHRIKAAWY